MGKVLRASKQQQQQQQQQQRRRRRRRRRCSGSEASGKYGSAAAQSLSRRGARAPCVPWKSAIERRMRRVGSSQFVPHGRSPGFGVGGGASGRCSGQSARGAGAANAFSNVPDHASRRVSGFDLQRETRSVGLLVGRRGVRNQEAAGLDSQLAGTS
jgi:hypothetical protein